MAKRLAPTVTSPAKMGEEMAHPSPNSAQSPNAKLAPRGVAGKGGTQVDGFGTKVNRTGHQERLGAKWAPQMQMGSSEVLPSATQTGRNVRLVPSAVGNRDFYNKRQFGQVQQ